MYMVRVRRFDGSLATMPLPVSQREVDEWRYFRRERPSETPLVQDAFPQCNAGEREFILSGIKPDEWDDMFPEEE